MLIKNIKLYSNIIPLGILYKEVLSNSALILSRYTIPETDIILIILNMYFTRILFLIDFIIDRIRFILSSIISRLERLDFLPRHTDKLLP